MSSILSTDDEALVKRIRGPQRETINAVADEHTRQLLLAAFGFRNSTLGQRRAVSRRITLALKKQILAYPAGVYDRTIAQQLNVAINPVSRLRRGTRK
jgi:hypothetical protein